MCGSGFSQSFNLLQNKHRYSGASFHFHLEHQQQRPKGGGGGGGDCAKQCGIDLKGLALALTLSLCVRLLWVLSGDTAASTPGTLNWWGSQSSHVVSKVLDGVDGREENETSSCLLVATTRPSH